MKWLEITVTTTPSAVDAITNILLECRSSGVAEESTAGGGVLLRGYLPVGPAADVARAVIEARIADLPRAGLDPGPALIDAQEIDDEGWAHAWKVHVQPFARGRLWITPTWDETPPPAGAVVIVLDPGMAFGSGLHPSTQQCLDVLERYVHGGETVFDVGTGSGILSIAAVKLGASSVLATDVDPVAVRVARENATHNGVADRIRVQEGSFLTGVPGQAEVIVANLTADLHLEFLPSARAALRPGGILAASGVVDSRLRDVEAIARAGGLRVVGSRQHGEWRCLVLSTEA